MPKQLRVALVEMRDLLFRFADRKIRCAQARGRVHNLTMCILRGGISNKTYTYTYTRAYTCVWLV